MDPRTITMDGVATTMMPMFQDAFKEIGMAIMARQRTDHQNRSPMENTSIGTWVQDMRPILTLVTLTEATRHMYALSIHLAYLSIHTMPIDHLTIMAHSHPNNSISRRLTAPLEDLARLIMAITIRRRYHLGTVLLITDRRADKALRPALPACTHLSLCRKLATVLTVNSLRLTWPTGTTSFIIRTQIISLFFRKVAAGSM